MFYETKKVDNLVDNLLRESVQCNKIFVIQLSYSNLINVHKTIKKILKNDFIELLF